MMIYNVTTHVNHAIAAEWFAWLQAVHIPDMMKTTCFTKYNILRLLEVDESEGLTYAVQYHAESKADYNRYIAIYAGGLREKSSVKWGNRCSSFRSVMQHVD